MAYYEATKLIVNKIDGIRDTCVYSILAAEFPAIDANLSFRLKMPNMQLARSKNHKKMVSVANK